MNHTCFHIISDHRNQFFNSVQEVKSTVNKWRDEGESYIKVFRIITEEVDSDVIDLQEQQIELEDTDIN